MIRSKKAKFFSGSGTINLFGRVRHLITHEPHIEHLLFYRFLLMSKSYELAHMIKFGRLSKADANLSDIDKVLKIYDLVGNIYVLPFQIWWVKHGQEIFQDNKPLTKITLTIDLSKGKNHVLKRVKKTISDAYAVSEQKSINKISLNPNKIRPSSLFHKLELLKEKSRDSLSIKKPLPKWNLAVNVGFGSKFIPELLAGIDDVEYGNKVRDYLGMFVSQKMTEAKWIAENAARGDFPNNKFLSTAKDFDFEKLSHIIKKTNDAELHLLSLQQDRPMNYFDELFVFTSSKFSNL